MKLKTVFAAGLSLLIFPLAAIEAVLSASPSRPVAGEVFALELTVNSTENFSWKVPSIPGLRVSRNFNSTSTRHTVINGKAEISAVYGLSAVAEKPGKLTIPRGASEVAGFAVPVAFTAVFTGLFMVIARKKALTQVIGFLVFENGITLFGAAVMREHPVIVELGILLDVLVLVFIMGIAVNQINREFSHIDSDRLNSLDDITGNEVEVEK